MDVIIVCHTEFGFVKDQLVIYDKNNKAGVKDGVLNLIKLADKYGAKITFAVCPEVVDYFPKKIEHEVGMHIHSGNEKFSYKSFSWDVGDTYLRENCKQSLTSTALRDYSYTEQFSMIKNGKEYLTERLGIQPKSFVAGRWSINNDTIKALLENGLTHDCSAPAHSISDHYNWSKLPRISMPYHPSAEDYQSKGNLPILIIPISQTLFGGTVSPEGVPIYGFSWLKACFLEYYKQGAPLFHICLHSPSMTDIYFISIMDDLISFMSKNKNINFKFVSDIKKYDSADISGRATSYLRAINFSILKTGFKKIFLRKKWRA
jgi:peptidoglycan/xylan/chitin deacetylase (PgdA/CDA1 family)